jgi:hypothetical protein
VLKGRNSYVVDESERVGKGRIFLYYLLSSNLFKNASLAIAFAKNLKLMTLDAYQLFPLYIDADTHKWSFSLNLGEVATDGSFTGDQVAFLYPDLSTALYGEFRY